MSIYYITTLILLIVIGVFTYRYVNEPQPIAERTESAMDELTQGNPDKAMDELMPQTRGENMINETKKAIGITPTY